MSSVVALRCFLHSMVVLVTKKKILCHAIFHSFTRCLGEACFIIRIILSAVSYQANFHMENEEKTCCFGLLASKLGALT